MFAHLARTTLAIAAAACLLAGGAAPTTFRHVIVVSVDGLRPECVSETLAAAYPGLARLARGPHTLSARCDPDISITLPNHVDMVTGRQTSGPEGHGWTKNDDPPARKHGGTLEAAHGSAVKTMFDVAHDRGLRTSLVVGKWKFVLLEQTCGEDAGGPDAIAPDDGRDKIDLFACDPQPAALTSITLSTLEVAASAGKGSLTMLHYPNADFAGHAKGWDLTEGSPYRQAVAAIDGALQGLLAGVDASERLRGTVAIVLTADHGGGVPFISHTDPAAPVNFTIPFLVWLGGDSAPADLYALNASVRRKPSPNERFTADAPPPIRNADAGNLALSLLGLPAIPGSTANAEQDLRVTGTSASASAAP
jgi:hypothetical protein